MLIFTIYGPASYSNHSSPSVRLRGLEKGIGKGCIGGFPVALHGFWGASGFGIDESTLKPETSNILLVYSPY